MYIQIIYYSRYLVCTTYSAIFYYYSCLCSLRIICSLYKSTFVIILVLCTITRVHSVYWVWCIVFRGIRNFNWDKECRHFFFDTHTCLSIHCTRWTRPCVLNHVLHSLCAKWNYSALNLFWYQKYVWLYMYFYIFLGFYQAVKHKLLGKENYYVDGMLLCNFPIQCFDGT